MGDSCGALEATRELAKAGWFVGIGSDSRSGWASSSRWASRWHHVQPPLGDSKLFIKRINQIARQHSYGIVFGAGDAEVLALSACREELTPLFPYTEHRFVLGVFDKLKLADLTRQAGLRAPSIYPAEQDQLSRLDFPVVVKSRLHWNPGEENKNTRVKAKVVQGRAEAMQRAREMRAVGATPIFQEFIPGHVETYVALTDRSSEILSYHVQRTTHEQGSESGISARALSVSGPAGFRRKVRGLLSDIQWFGLASIQFIRPENGEPVLIDFNGRMYGSLVFANACGMHAMENWVRLALDQEPVPSSEILGLRYQALEGDLRRAKKRAGNRRIREVISCLTESTRTVHPILALSDPMPTVHYLKRLIRRQNGKRAREYER